MNSNLKRVVGYLAYVAAFGLLVILVETMNHYFQDVYRITFAHRISGCLYRNSYSLFWSVFCWRYPIYQDIQTGRFLED